MHFATRVFDWADTTFAITVLPALFDNYIYVVSWGDCAAVVDPAEAGPVRQYLDEQGLSLETILITHHHQDHVGGVLDLKKSAGCEVVGPADRRVPGVDRAVGEGEEVVVGPLRLLVIETPGHGSKDLSYYAETGKGQPNVAWTGDTLFCGGCGRLFEGTPGQMWASLSKLAALPGDTLVYCGHEYTVENLRFARSLQPDDAAVSERLRQVEEGIRGGEPSVPSSIDVEKATNPFLRADSTAMRRALDMEQASPEEVFAAIRARKDVF